MRTRLTVALFAAFIGAIVAANYVTSHYGFIPVGFGLTATAGTFFAGLTFGFRDLIQDAAGRRGTAIAILAGAVLSAVVSPTLAVASGTAFLLSEAADYLVYTPLRRRSWDVAVLASNVVGSVLDTVVFIGLAFGTSAIAGAVPGQLVGKTWATLAVLGGVRAIRASRR